MPRLSPLTVRLRYLEPVRKQLDALGPDDVHEGTDLSVLRRVVRKRIKGLSKAESHTALGEDAAELEKWLSESGRENERLHFILPILPDAVEVLLAERQPEPPERGEVSMELPHGAKVTKENGCWSVKWLRMLLSLYPSHCEDMHRSAGQFRDDAKTHPMTADNGMTVADVRFGNVVGVKSVSKTSSPALKRVDYAMEVPGGFVVAVLDSTAGDFDESELEAHFHTLRVVNCPPPTVE
jgi:hypothetical protein